MVVPWLIAGHPELGTKITRSTKIKRLPLAGDAFSSGKGKTMIEKLSGAAPRSDPGDSKTAGISGAHIGRRRDHLVILDSTWGKLLGARKIAGVYQIRSSELLLKLMLR